MRDTIRAIAGDTAPLLLAVQAFAADGAPVARAVLRADVRAPAVTPYFATTSADGRAQFRIPAGTSSAALPIVVRLADPARSGPVLATATAIIAPAAVVRFVVQSPLDSLGFAGETTWVVVSGFDRFGNPTGLPTNLQMVSRDSAVATVSGIVGDTVTIARRGSGTAWLILTSGTVSDSVRVTATDALLPPSGTTALRLAGVTTGTAWITSDSATHRRLYRRNAGAWASVPLADGEWIVTTAGDGLLFARSAANASELWSSTDEGASWRSDLSLTEPIRAVQLAKGRPAIVVVSRASPDVGWRALRRLNGSWTPLAWPTDVSDSSWRIAPVVAYAGPNLTLLAPIKGPVIGQYFGIFTTVASIRRYALSDTGWAFTDTVPQPFQVTQAIDGVSDTILPRIRLRIAGGNLVLVFPPSPTVQSTSRYAWLETGGLLRNTWLASAPGRPDAMGRIMWVADNAVQLVGGDDVRRTVPIPPAWVASTDQTSMLLDGPWCWLVVVPLDGGDQRARVARLACPVQ